MPFARQVALLAVLTAVNSVVRLMGAGFAGIETAFALIIVAGYIFGKRFGFQLGALSILTSALVSGGVGPWLPFQVIAAALVGFGAGVIPKSNSKTLQLVFLSAYAAIASYVYGALLTLWTWPLFVGAGTSLSFVQNDTLWNNAVRFFQFELVSGGLIWDTGRAITTVCLIALSGKSLMAILERAATRVNFSET